MSSLVQEVNYFDAAAFTTTAPVAASGWKHHPALQGHTMAPIVNADSAQRINRRGQSTPEVVTNQQGAMSLTSQIHGGSLADDGASGDTAPSGAFLQELIANYFGAAPTHWGGTTVAVANTGTGTSVAPLTLTSGTGLSAGDFIQAGSERRCVVYKPTTDSAVLDRALTVGANYAAGATVYGSFSFSCTIGEYRYIWLLAKKFEHTTLYGPGGITGMKLGNIAAGDGLRMIMDYMSDGFVESPGYTDPTTFEDAVSKFSGAPLVAVGAPIAINGVETECIDFDVDFGVSHQWKRATSGANARSGMRVTGCKPSGNCTTYWSSTIRGYYTSRTKIPLMLDVPNGSTNIAKARNSGCVYIPNATIVIPNDDGVENEQNVIKFSWQGHDPEAASQAQLLTKAIYFGLFGGRPV